jgi:hypothetical protein
MKTAIQDFLNPFAVDPKQYNYVQPGCKCRRSSPLARNFNNKIHDSKQRSHLPKHTALNNDALPRLNENTLPATVAKQDTEHKMVLIPNHAEPTYVTIWLREHKS